MTERFVVTGMSCAACQARVEKAVSKLDGVESCSVSLLTNSMNVEGTAPAAEIIEAVENAGYGASVKGDASAGGAGGAGNTQAGETIDQSAAAGGAGTAATGSTGGETHSIYADEEEALRDHETPVLKRRLVTSIGFLAVLMYFSMGHMMWNWPIPAWFEGNHVAMGLVQMLFALIIMFINRKFFTSGFTSAIHGAPNMDTLVAMGSAASFGWSLFVLFKMTGDVARGDEAAVMDDMNNFYFESAAMIVTLITVGKMLEAMSKGRTTDALKGLMKMAPKTAVIFENGEEKEVPIGNVAEGDIFCVRTGGMVPVDGVIIEGSAAVDESALTGESIPVDKEIGDHVSAATISRSGYIKAKATRVGRDTTLSQIIEMVSNAAATKAPIAKIADRVSGIFVPAVIAVAVIVLIIWLFVGQTVGYALARAISVLVISCPCALGLATPVSIMVAGGLGAKNGILFKTASALEEAGRINTVILDKTGTITRGEPEVTDIVPASGASESELLESAFSLEKKSEHPLAGAILKYCEERGVRLHEVTEFETLPGNGLTANIGEDKLAGGNLKFIKEQIGIAGAEELPEAESAVNLAAAETKTNIENRVSESGGSDKIDAIDTALSQMQKKAAELAEQGKTCLYFARGGKLLGMIAVADVIKEDSPRAIKELQDMGMRVVMLTGDDERTARAISEQAGVDDVIAGVLPDGKEQVVREYREKGKVAMIGDGINDAPALTRADVGIAIGAGTDVAVDAASIVLMNSKLTDAAAAIRLSKAALRNIHENLFWAFIYNAALIPLAAGAYAHLLGWSMNPMWGAAAMSLSSFCVVTNALRLNLFKLYRNKNDVHASSSEDLNTKVNIQDAKTKEDIAMEKNIKIEGMMCEHCEATVKKALEALDGVESADVSHAEDRATVHLAAEVSDEVLKKAVEDKDYTVIEIS